uniref:BTB domain-containing protein n=2 Tax=Caenorhabditis tropicalis TaxID=1561998 RepID=A0A1I7UKV2_9PELO
MINRRKYAINDIYFFAYAREYLELGLFDTALIGTIGGIDGWYLTMKWELINNAAYFYPIIYARGMHPKLKSRYFFDILKNNGSSEVPCEYSADLRHSVGATGRKKTVGELLNEENGYLTNGGIIIEYGIQIEGILSPNDIWTFNFRDPVFDCQEKSNMIIFKKIRYGETKFFYCHKQLLTHHSTYFNSNSKENQIIELTDEDLIHFNHFLQLSHGVRDRTYRYATINALKYAQKYKLFNVIQLIDQFIILDRWDFGAFLPQKMSYDLKHCLALFLKEQKTSKELAEKLKKVNIETMIGEAMKKCVKRFLEF